MRNQTRDIRQFILDHLERHPSDISLITAMHFNISRQAASRHVRQMIYDGLLLSRGKGRGIRYDYKTIVDQQFTINISPESEEDRIWREFLKPLFDGVDTNVQEICHYGFTEMFNNVIDHSGSNRAHVQMKRTPVVVEITVTDFGIGIFKKIQTALHLEDERHAILELSKGKLTTDPERHTGEGIFFTSRMFDDFLILSGGLFYSHTAPSDDWLLENKAEKPGEGTIVNMRIHPQSKRTMKDVFDEYASGQFNYAFAKTHVVVSLVQDSENDSLVSRSQAKRLLARCDLFQDVMLDFKHVKQIGRAFADEIFRVFKRQHPNIHIEWLNTSEEVKRMIESVLRDASSPA